MLELVEITRSESLTTSMLLAVATIDILISSLPSLLIRSISILRRASLQVPSPIEKVGGIQEIDIR